MDVEMLTLGWRNLSLTVGEKLGRPVGVGKVRWAVESSGLRIGRKIGGGPRHHDGPCARAGGATLPCGG